MVVVKVVGGERMVLSSNARIERENISNRIRR